MTGFGIEETADGFILRRGDEEMMRMSKEEFFSLRAQMNLWTERRLLEFQPRSGEVRQIVSHPIAWADVWPDAIQENVLLILSLTETQVVFSLPIPIASGLVGALARVLSEMQPSPRALAVEWLTPQRRAISRLPKVGFLVIIFWDEESPTSSDLCGALAGWT